MRVCCVTSKQTFLPVYQSFSWSILVYNLVTFDLDVCFFVFLIHCYFTCVHILISLLLSAKITYYSCDIVDFFVIVEIIFQAIIFFFFTANKAHKEELESILGIFEVSITILY